MEIRIETQWLKHDRGSIDSNKKNPSHNLRRIFLVIIVIFCIFISDNQIFVYEFQVLQPKSDGVVSV